MQPQLISSEEIEYWQEKRGKSWRREYNTLLERGLPLS